MSVEYGFEALEREVKNLAWLIRNEDVGNVKAYEDRLSKVERQLEEFKKESRDEIKMLNERYYELKTIIEGLRERLKAIEDRLLGIETGIGRIEDLLQNTARDDKALKQDRVLKYFTIGASFVQAMLILILGIAVSTSNASNNDNDIKNNDNGEKTEEVVGNE